MPEIIADDVVVTIDYILRSGGGEVLDQSDAGDPLTYLHGHDNIVPGLEQALTGKKVGDVVQIAVPPEEGYGVRDPEGVRVIDRDSFPPDAELTPGINFVAELEDGEQVQMWVVGVDDDQVHIDMNHPLAGVTLHFEVKVIELRKPLAGELAHGHPHGRTGSEHHHH
ncbi:MAG: peptidylprolyl isomerase [Deltaproteobacteria bacterium]|jgi:FKBP-type peptidyl-prolyl cis-trans isomerase SlyD|nr:peptidylprolyl isomerase [Deltaproteobacteria bacterium]